MTDENSTQASPFTMWWWIAGGFFLLVIVATVVMLATRGGSPQADTTTTPTASADATPSSSEPDGGALVEPSGAVCSLPAEDQDIPVDPPEATWEADGYILVPSSEVYGPISGEEPLWPCFAHSPTGALFAATHLYVGTIDLDYEEFVHAAAVEGPALEAWVSEQDPARKGQDPGGTIQYAGFRFQQVEPDAVVVDVAGQQHPVTGYIRISLVWDAEADNWKVDMASSNLKPTSIESLSSFTPWSAE